MRKNKYLKAKLTADTEEDCLYNTFWIYLAGISELLLIVMLQGELNYISIPCLIAAGIVLGVCAYRVGQNSKDTITYFTELQQYHHRLSGICAFWKESDCGLLQREDQKGSQGHSKG